MSKSGPKEGPGRIIRGTGLQSLDHLWAHLLQIFVFRLHSVEAAVICRQACKCMCIYWASNYYTDVYVMYVPCLPLSSMSLFHFILIASLRQQLHALSRSADFQGNAAAPLLAHIVSDCM